MRENDEITGLFRSRLAGAEMTVREDFWEGLQRDLPSPNAHSPRKVKWVKILMKPSCNTSWAASTSPV